MIWYKFHLGDYITRTLHLADAEDLAYRRLLDLYYMSEKPIPLDIDSVSRRIRLDADVTEMVLREFFTRTPAGYRNTRCDAEIAKYRHQCETNRSIGQRGGRPKKTESEPTTNRKQTLKETEEEKEKEKETPKPPLSAPPTGRFAEFWSVWPASKRKVGKAAVQAKWRSRHLDQIADQIIAHVAAMKTTEQWTTGFEPAPMTYLNQSRWEDDKTGPESILARRVI
jgi:uncharacterized protein YdaU (DUF1376 family)